MTSPVEAGDAGAASSEGSGSSWGGVSFEALYSLINPALQSIVLRTRFSSAPWSVTICSAGTSVRMSFMKALSVDNPSVTTIILIPGMVTQIRSSRPRDWSMFPMIRTS